MGIKVATLKAGDVLYDCHSEKAGNTACRRDGVWIVRVMEVNAAEGWALCSWNSNTPRKHYRTLPSTWRRSPKEWNRSMLGREATCYVCDAEKSQGHRIDCDHPAAVRARKRAAKAQVCCA